MRSLCCERRRALTCVGMTGSLNWRVTSLGASVTFGEVVKYLEAAAYIAIVLAVLGVPQMLSSYFDIRERRGAREEAERARQTEREEAERARQAERAEAERRHTEMMTALFAIIDRTNDGRHDTPARDEDVNTEILRRLSVIESALGIATEPDDDGHVA